MDGSTVDNTLMHQATDVVMHSAVNDPLQWTRLPSDLVIYILSFAVPEMRQCISKPSEGRRDILPALLPSDPMTWPPLVNP